MAPFAQPTPDENLVQGWNVQGNFAATSTGVPGAGFAQPAAIGPVANVGQASAGGNSQAGGVAPFETNVLVNGSYSVSPTTSLLQSAAAPIPTTAGVQQPYGVNTLAAVTGASVTSIAVAPFTTGTPVYTTVATFTASANAVTVSIPPGGFIKTGGANATAVVYTPTN